MHGLKIDLKKSALGLKLLQKLLGGGADRRWLALAPRQVIFLIRYSALHLFNPARQRLFRKIFWRGVLSFSRHGGYRVEPPVGARAACSEPRHGSNL
jgi:hypothetical protein